MEISSKTSIQHHILYLSKTDTQHSTHNRKWEKAHRSTSAHPPLTAHRAVKIETEKGIKGGKDRCWRINGNYFAFVPFDVCFEIHFTNRKISSHLLSLIDLNPKCKHTLKLDKFLWKSLFSHVYMLDVCVCKCLRLCVYSSHKKRIEDKLNVVCDGMLNAMGERTPPSMERGMRKVWSFNNAERNVCWYFRCICNESKGVEK